MVAARVRQRKIVEVFLAASRTGDMNALLAVLDPDVVRRADRIAIPPGADTEIHGAQNVVTETVTNSGLAQFARSAIKLSIDDGCHRFDLI